MENGVVWINGRISGIKGASIPVLDRGFLYGDGAFETMRSYAGVVFKLDGHLARLQRSLGILMICPVYTNARLSDSVGTFLRTSGFKNAYIRLVVTRGNGMFGMAHKDSLKPNTVIIAKEFEGYPARMHSRGIAATIADTRLNEQSPLCGAKTLSFLNYIISRFRAQKAGYDEAILLNIKGNVAEAATSNIFLVKGGRLITPSLESGALPGITRRVVLDVAGKLGLKKEERVVKPFELAKADELFLTNSLAEILPVVSLEHRKIGAGSSGEVTKLLRISYQKEVIKYVLRRLK